jgi:subtilisin family serine protease
MRGRHAGVIVMLLVLGTILPAHALWDASWTDKMFGKTWVLTPHPTEVVVRFAPGTSEALREAVAQAHGLVVRHPFYAPTGVVVYEAPAGASALAVAQALDGEPGVLGSLPATVDQEGFTKYVVPGQVAVQFRKDLDDATCRELIRAAGAEVVYDHWTPGYYTVTVPEGMSVFDAVRYWQAHALTLFAEPSYMCYDDALYVPNDPLYPDQWALNNTGGYGGGIPGADVDAEAAWDITRGDPDVIICIIDTGIDTDHPDLADNILPRNGEDWNFANDNSDVPEDASGHGTCCSGIAAAVQDNATGVSGIAPGCRIMPLKVNLTSGLNQNRADAINYATSRRPEFKGLVISGSWKMSSGDFTAVQAACQNAWDNDVVLCFASGNEDGPVNYPAAYSSTIAVGASSPCDERKSPDSCDGETWWGSNYGPELEVIAPGVKIYTTDMGSGGGYTGTDYMGYFNGTSAATPLAAGICALIWSLNPGLSNAEVRQILQDSADDQVGPSDEDAPGWDPYYGFGRVNAYQALLLAFPQGFEDDMEAGVGEWTHEIVFPQLGYGDAWHLSSNRNHTPGGQFAWMCGDSAGGDYDPEISAALVSPPVVVLPGSVLRFWHWMDAYAPDDETAGDAGVLEMSTDGGTRWYPLTPAGGYTHVWHGGSMVPFANGQGVWSGSFDWRQETVFLGDLSGLVQFRWRFGTRGELPTGEGWYVDDVELLIEPSGAPDRPEAASGEVLARVWPNPASGPARLAFETRTAGEVRLTLYDPSGRRVGTGFQGLLGPGTHEVVLRPEGPTGRGLPSGVYLFRLRTPDGEKRGRVVFLGR